MARRVGITPEQVLWAAAEAADRDGFENLTLAAVARLLGVRPPSLYAHVDGLAGLRRLLTVAGANALDAALSSAAEGRSGTEALRAFGHAYRRFAHRHPGLYAASQVGSPADPDDEVAIALARPVAMVAAVLTELGHRPDDAVPLIRAYRAALHGWVDLERSGGFGLPDDVGASFETMIDVIVGGFARRAEHGSAAGNRPAQPSA